MTAQADQATLLKSLREEIRQVREAILAMVVRMDDIRLQQIPQIRADYALKIGCWEQTLLEAELAGRRARRRLQLAQAQANRGEVPEMVGIEATLDSELAEWMAKAEQARLAYQQALYERATTGLGIAVRGGESWYRGSLHRAEGGLARVRQELNGGY